MNVIDNIGGVGAFHVKVDLLLRHQLGKVDQSGSDDDGTMDLFRRRKPARDVLYKPFKVILDLFLICLCDYPEGDRIISNRGRRLGCRDRIENEAGAYGPEGDPRE